ncbi:hypothetical protein [Phytohabitans rumicis]|uniref:Uncharacterized protein n=1 Tax=Phytohabitans rumicis TaxID=1076125 RepID=A0A6V8LU75_9ACTN|nr:hypothetical protein [Phytohabitans rumicis]GFJ96315.1 hypothetical protein Prum_099570 [Phytohabitans rumicis]
MRQMSITPGLRRAVITAVALVLAAAVALLANPAAQALVHAGIQGSG